MGTYSLQIIHIRFFYVLLILFKVRWTMLKIRDGKNKLVSLSSICMTLTLMAGAVFSFYFFFAAIKVIFDNQLEFFSKTFQSFLQSYYVLLLWKTQKKFLWIGIAFRVRIKELHNLIFFSMITQKGVNFKYFCDDRY